MSVVIGIDTGGTCTDAVIFEPGRGVLAWSKAPTTHEDLSKGIARALSELPPALAAGAERLSLSTTLATNACAEGKGCRAALLLIGVPEKALASAGAAYGLSPASTVCADAEEPDWEALLENEIITGAEALAVAQTDAMRNGAPAEKKARALFSARLGVPVVAAHELAGSLNVMERGATALLNARLLPVIAEFLDSAAASGRPGMTVRSDGSLMSDALARERPVETVLSGPAASVIGACALADEHDCLTVDMGGTTTDISIVRSGLPVMTGGIRLGGWRTQVGGIFADTFALGGDSRVYIKDGELKLDSRRVEPLCSFAERFPGAKAQLEYLLDRNPPPYHPWQEFLFLTRPPREEERLGRGERELVERLSSGPIMIGGEGVDVYSLRSSRLEAAGVVMRCGMTPTDAMAIRGDFTRFSPEASELAAAYMTSALPGCGGKEDFCERIYGLVKKKLYENIVRVLLADAFPGSFDRIDAQTRALIGEGWAGGRGGAFSMRPRLEGAIVGLGAPSRVFLPDVAGALGARCVLPEFAEVANAVGAAAAGVSARVSLGISQRITPEGGEEYILHAPDGPRAYKKACEAEAAGRECAAAAAEAEARRRGAAGAIKTVAGVSRRTAYSRDGAEIDLGRTVSASATAEM